MAALHERVELQPLKNRDKVVVIVEAVVKAADAWSLTNEEAAALFDVTTTTWSRMRSGTFNGILDRDKLTRASLIVGLFKGLRLLFNGPLTYGWPKSPNRGELYEGRTPIEVMISGGIPAMDMVRQHIDSLRGGL